jgi:hypothetical protein
MVNKYGEIKMPRATKNQKIQNSKPDTEMNNKKKKLDNAKNNKTLKESLWFYLFYYFVYLKYFKFFKIYSHMQRPPKHKHRHYGFEDLPKIIWIYWGQGWNNAPNIVKLCKKTWIYKNPNWEVISLDQNNISKYVNLNKYTNKKINYTSLSDIIRINILSKYGGIWVDSTVLCKTPLDNWLPILMQSGFFAFNKPGIDRMLSSWFLAAKKDNYIIKIWKKYVDIYWKYAKKPSVYYWFHYIFEDIFKKNQKFRYYWLNTPKISAHPPHLLQKNILKKKNIRDCLDSLNKSPVHKLSHKIKISDLLIEKIKIKIFSNDLYDR